MHVGGRATRARHNLLVGVAGQMKVPDGPDPACILHFAHPDLALY